MTEHEHYYKALGSKDHRFDGVFFVGVTSTGIYCRPVCPARTPKKENCKFFKSAAEAEISGFRPCLKCRPELAPGLAPVDSSKRLAQVALAKIQDTTETKVETLNEIADSMGISSRHLRRVLQTEYGVSPAELAKTQRLLTAKRLLTETEISLTEIAFASGFQSIRSFNHIFKKQYGITPSQLRSKDSTKAVSEISLKLNYRPPLAWDLLLAFLKARAANGVEYIGDNLYIRSVKFANICGWLKVKRQNEFLQMECSPELLTHLPMIVRRLNILFDLDCHPETIRDFFKNDPILKAQVRSHPGLRIPGAFDEFEVCVRAIAGQLVSVKAASSITSKFVDTFGDPLETPFQELNRIFPSPIKVASLKTEEIQKCGFTKTKAQAIISLAQIVADGKLDLRYNLNTDEVLEKLMELPGVGPWTANYIAMRVLRDPDAFPAQDLVIQKALGAKNKKAIIEMSQRWKPWRAYAAMYLWLKEGEKKNEKL